MALDEDKGALTLAYADGMYSVLAAVLTASTMGAPMLVIFKDAVNSACGQASSAVAPLSCSGDNHAYLDLSFFQDLRQRSGAPGNFARAYVLAHEIGHHVQNQMGISEKVAQQRSRSSEVASNALSMRFELQADCFAGVWDYYTKQRNPPEPGDVEAGLSAATAIGNDRLQVRRQWEAG